MLQIEYDPDNFGVGIMVPISKGDSRNQDKTDDYRDTCLNPVLSKVFEHCILVIFGKVLETSSRQFIFKLIDVANALRSQQFQPPLHFADRIT